MRFAYWPMSRTVEIDPNLCMALRESARAYWLTNRDRSPSLGGRPDRVVRTASSFSLQRVHVSGSRPRAEGVIELGEGELSGTTYSLMTPSPASPMRAAARPISQFGLVRGPGEGIADPRDLALGQGEGRGQRSAWNAGAKPLRLGSAGSHNGSLSECQWRCA